MALRDWSWIPCSGADSAAERLTLEVLHTIEAHVPSKLIFDRASLHPWYNERCCELIREKRQAEGTPAYKLLAEQCSRGLFDEYCKFTKQTQEKFRNLRRGSKQWWRLSAQSMDKSTVSFGVSALKDGDVWVLDPAEKANLLERTFA